MNRLLAASLIIASMASQSAFAAAVPGSAAPDFVLPDITGKAQKLSDYRGKYVVVEWFNQGCPFVQKHYESGNMQGLQQKYTSKGVVWLSVNSSAAGKQGNYSPAEWKKLSAERNALASAILLDADGATGKAYGAKTTPHMYIIDQKGILQYAGAIDSTPSKDADDIKTSQNYVSSALDELLSGKPVKTKSTKAYGCSVKY